MNTHKIFDWLRYVERSGDPGRAWVASYRQPPLRRLVDASQTALEELRGRRYAEAQRRLDDYRREVEELAAGGLPASIGGVLWRWYHAVEAYARYVAGDYPAALDELCRATTAVERAIGAEPALLPLADHCADFRFQAIRIHRNRRDWSTVVRKAEELRRVARSEEPLCRVGERAVTIRELGEYFEAVPDLPEDEREWLRSLLAVDKRLLFIDRFFLEITCKPEFVIPYG